MKPVVLSPQQGTAKCHHPKVNLSQFLHHIYLPLQVFLSLLAVPIYSNVQTVFKLENKMQ